MNYPIYKTEGVNRTQTVRFYPFVFTGNDPRKGWRIPLNEIKYNEQRDEETCYGYCDDYQPHAVKRMFDYNSGMLYDMRWDKAGNLGQVSMARLGEMFETGRFLGMGMWSTLPIWRLLTAKLQIFGFQLFAIWRLSTAKLEEGNGGQACPTENFQIPPHYYFMCTKILKI